VKAWGKNIEDPKIPKVQDLLLLCSLMPHSLFRFLAGDHYAKGKSIKHEC